MLQHAGFARHRHSVFALALGAALALHSAVGFAAPPQAPKTGGPGTQAPNAAAPQGGGSLDKELIKGTIRQHISEVKNCYEIGLIKKPDLQGRVMVQFTIGLEGNILSATVASSTLNEPPIESCITKVVTKWTFPRPQGGTVVVTYPFVFKPNDDPRSKG